jgi:hypothetical protein
MDTASTLIDEEVAKRLDLTNDRSVLVGGIELRVNAPRTSEWDVPRLIETLNALVDEGRLGGGVPIRCVNTKIEYKPVARELSKLLEHEDPRVRDLIGECRQMVPQKRRVSVKGEQRVIN